MRGRASLVVRTVVTLCLLVLYRAIQAPPVQGQGVTTSAITGFVRSTAGVAIAGATVRAVHVPTGTQYTALASTSGAYVIPNMRIGGPYTISVQQLGYQSESREDIYLELGKTERVDFSLREQAVQLAGIEVGVLRDEVFNSQRTGAATFIPEAKVTQLPSIKRSTRDLIRLDPRNDGNYSFAGRNWLYNNITLDGSYFNNPYGLDDPAPGGQTAAEPVPFDAVEQVRVSVAPFDVREGGFTGANVNTVTKSGTNEFRASAYTFIRNESLIGNKVRGEDVIANPDLSFNQSGFTVSGPFVRDKLFFFLNAELERRDDPGTSFVADQDGTVGFGEARVRASVMDQIRQRMIDVYDYDPGAYEGYVHATDSDKLLAKLDWNVSEHHNLSVRYNFLDGRRDLGPHAFVFSFNNTGRGPSPSSLPFQNSGYTVNNELHSVALELNSRTSRFANRFFASYNRFRDFREPFSEDFPTIEIGEAGVTYTTVGHEPFSIHNVLDQDVLQLTNNFTVFRGSHSLTMGANFEHFSFFNSFNLFRHGFFQFPVSAGGATFASLQEFFAETAPADPIDFRGMIGSGPFKGEKIDVGQLSFYAQDELLASPNLTLTFGLRLDLPMYFTEPVDNPYSRDLTALDENDQAETVDQSDLPGTKTLLSPRLGFNWDMRGDETTQLRGGTGVFTGRVPFVWVGNVISNPGANPNLHPAGPQRPTSDDATLAQSFDLNAMDPDFTWPQVWITDLALDQRLPWGLVGTLEVVYGNDLNSIYMRNSDLVRPVRTLSDGRPYFGGFGANELNPDFGAGIYVIDNADDGYNLNVSAQLRKVWDSGLDALLAYAYTRARNRLKSTEIASVLWANQPVQGDPNTPELSWSEFGQRHRIIGSATHRVDWSERLATRFGLFFEVAEGNRFTASGGNRYSFLYAGDVNGDGTGGNDLMYIPRSQNEIRFDPFTDASGRTVSAAEQWTRLDAFIEQDKYLRDHRGEIAERFGAVNPWYSNIDLRILQDFRFLTGSRPQTFQLNLDVLNVANLISSDWGVRKVADPAATSPLRVARFAADGEPVFNFTGPASTYVDDPGIFSRWQIQLGLKYLFN
jgi:hypothetical protein